MMSQNTTSLQAGPSSEDWDARRPQFVRLYLEEGKKLKEVMAIMNRNGFKATEKMYKSRINKWGLDKKMKEHEAWTIMRLHAQRHGRPTQIKLRGRTVDINRVKSYLLRKGLSIEEVSSSTTIEPRRMDLICRTPLPTPHPDIAGASIRPGANFTSLDELFLTEPQASTGTTIPPKIEGLDGLKTVECLFSDITEYITGCNSRGTWIMWQNLDNVIHSLKVPVLIYSHLVDYTIRGLQLSSTDRTSAAQTLRVAFTAVDFIIKGEMIATVRSILKLLDFLTERKQHKIAWFLCHAIPALASSEHDKGLRMMTPVFERVFLRLALIIGSQNPHHLVWEAAQRVALDCIEASVSLRSKKPSALGSTMSPYYCLESSSTSHHFCMAEGERGRVTSKRTLMISRVRFND